MVWWRKLKERIYLQDLDVYGGIILMWIFKKCDGGHGLDWSDSGQGQVAVYYEYGDETSGSIKCEEILD
jgi:hypothetical protein